MKWIKKGLIYLVQGNFGFDYSHCHKPTPLQIDDSTLRIYFGTRDRNGRTRSTFIDVDADDLTEVKYIHRHPIIDLGKTGTFDDSGANVCSVVRSENRIFMYYIGWNPSTTVHTRNAIGLVVSDDGGTSFNRLYDGSIVDRNKDEPYYTGAVDVIKQDDIWKMWYTSGSEWKIINGKPEICYHIKYAISHNGIDWERNDVDSILPEHPLEAVARPSVLKEDGVYKMWYSKRNIDGFRINPINGYRGGYAESRDGISWLRKDAGFGLEISKEGWDAEAIAYPYVFRLNERLIMLYNGNGFGKTGFGYAECYE